MPPKISLSGIKAREYLLKYPTASENSIAKMLVKDFPHIFTNVNQARMSLSLQAGKRKNGSGKKCSNPIIRYTDFSRENPMGKPFITNINTKILILDIETAPLLAFVWGIWEQNIQYQAIQSDWFILTWSAKWLFEDKVYSAKLTPKEATKQDDKRIMLSIWNMLNEADIVITHNGDKFDIKKLNTRFLVHGMNPPLPYISIDTLKHNKKQFAHSSNKLDYINASLGVPRKMEHEGFPMWVKCYKGDPKALKTMEDYNVQDVRILEDLYLRIRQWIKPHPNLALHITDEKVEHCPTCTSDNLKMEKKQYYTKTAGYGLFRCNDCGAVGRQRVTSISKDRAHYLKVSV